MTVTSRVRPRNPQLVVAATFLSALMLAGCANPGPAAPTEAPVAPSITATPSATPTKKPDPTPQPTATAAPTASPVATATSDPAPNPAATQQPTSPSPIEVPAGWETVTIDGWAQFSVPTGWTSGRNPTHVAESTSRYLIDPEGELRIRVDRELHGQEIDPGECEPTAPWFEVLDTTPLPQADSTEEVAQSTHIQQISIYNYENGGEDIFYEVNSTLHELDRMAPDCVPEFVVYREATGGYYNIALNSEPQEDLHFTTKEEARAYAETDEYLTAKNILQTFRYVG